MKTKLTVLISLVLVVMVGFVVAGEQGRGNRAAVSRPERPATSRAQYTVSREQQSRQMLAAQAAEHRDAIEELKKIQDLAKEEGATKTAEAVQKLIDKKNAEYKNKVEEAEKVRRQRVERLGQVRRNTSATEADTEAKTD